MEKIISAILILVGLINLYPAIGVLSAETLSGLYLIDIQSNDLLILLRHRAVFFGLLGALIIYSAFKRDLQWWAAGAGLLSMLSFIALALLVGGYGAGVRKVVVADIIASAGLLLTLGLRLWRAKP